LGSAVYINSAPPSIPPPAAIQKAESISTGNPSKCSAGTKFFPQPIDYATFKGDWSDSKQIFNI
jgi:hypothetical protein